MPSKTAMCPQAAMTFQRALPLTFGARSRTTQPASNVPVRSWKAGCCRPADPRSRPLATCHAPEKRLLTPLPLRVSNACASDLDVFRLALYPNETEVFEPQEERGNPSSHRAGLKD